MGLLQDILDSQFKDAHEKAKRKQNGIDEPSLLGAFKDPQFRQDVKRGLLDSLNRGGVAMTIGAPADIGGALMNSVGMAGSVIGHKAGLLSADQMYQPVEPTFGSEWWGKQMQDRGMVSDKRNMPAEVLSSFVVPGAMTKAGQGLFKAEQAAIKNAQIAGPVTSSPLATQRGVFGGINAKTADKAKLAQAEQMLNKGVDPAQVWKETGWGRGPDGKWRFEIDDSGANFFRKVKQPSSDEFQRLMDAQKLIRETEKEQQALRDAGKFNVKDYFESRPGLYKSLQEAKGIKSNYRLNYLEPQPKSGQLDQFLDHDKLFEAYPELQSMHTIWNPSGDGGAYSSQLGVISVGGQNPKSPLMHEVMHAVQDDAGFAKGSSPEAMRSVVAERQALADNFERAKQQLLTSSDPVVQNNAAQEMSYYGTRLGKMPKVSTAEEAYFKNGGEAEARLVQARLNLTPEERRAQFPFEPEYYKQQTGVVLDDLIHRFDGGEAKHIPDWAQQEALKRLQAMQRGENVPSVIKGGLLTTDTQKDGLNSAYSLLTQGKQPPYQKNVMDLNIGHIYDARVSGKLKQSGKYADSFDPTDVVPWMARAGDDSATVGVKRGVPSLQNQFTDPQTGETFMVSLPVSSDFATGKQWVSGLIPEGKFKK